jgi:superfamily II DNA/RNA helicase
VHRIGRTARAGATGVGITFVGTEQARDVGRIARDLRLTEQFSRSGHAVEGPSRTNRGGGGNRRRRPQGRPGAPRHATR